MYFDTCKYDFDVAYYTFHQSGGVHCQACLQSASPVQPGAARFNMDWRRVVDELGDKRPLPMWLSMEDKFAVQ